MAGARCKGRKKKTWKECVDNNRKVLGLHPEWTVFRDVCVKELHIGQTSNPSVVWKKWAFSK